MPKEPAPEGKARADELRKEIDRILHPDREDDPSGKEGGEAGGAGKKPSPRDFIQRKMRDLDKKDQP